MGEGKNFPLFYLFSNIYSYKNIVIMRNIILISLILFGILSGCRVKKSITTDTTINTETNSNIRTSETITDIRVPKSNIFLSDRIVTSPSGVYTSISRTIVDPTTNQTLKLDVNEKGEITVSSITNADTLRVSNKNTINNTNQKTSTDIKTDEKTDVKFDISSILQIAISAIIGFIPGGGIITTIILILFLGMIFVLIRKIFRKKNDDSQK